MNQTLPQLCYRCRNRDIGGRLKMPDQGVFKKKPDRYDDWYWMCNGCNHDRPNSGHQHEPTPLEKRVITALVASGHAFTREFELESFRFDFCLPELALLIEADSYTWHRRPRQISRDRAKDELATGLGWKVSRVRDPDIEGQTKLAVNLRQKELFGR